MIAIKKESLREIETQLVTEFEHPEVMMPTKDGDVTFLEWLYSERQRLKNKNDQTRIYCNGGGRVALVRN